MAVMYSSQGTGPGILLVHGIGTSRRYFAPLADCLAATHHVVAPDLPGFGKSGRPRPALSISGQAAAMESVIEEAGLHRPLLVGHSMGAEVVTELAVRNPGLARGIVLIGPVVDPSAPTAVRQAARLAHDVLGEPVRFNAVVLWDYLRGGPRSFFGTLPHMLSYPLEEKLAKVSEPIVLVRGVRDPIAPRAFFQRLRDRTGAEVVEIPDARHLAMSVQPEAVAEICRRFG
nr:Alpha/beta hydrolase family [uncultured organism]